METPRTVAPESHRDDRPLSKAEAANASRVRAARLEGIAEAAMGLGHEIRNLLQHLGVTFELLTDLAAGHPDAIRAREVSEDEIHQVLDLFNRLREFTGPVKLTLGPCRVGEVWSEATRALALRTEERGIAVSPWPDDVEDRCTLDHGAIRQLFVTVLEYVLTNRSEASRIELDCNEMNEAVPPYVMIAIRDDGAELTAQQRKSVFDLFTPARHGRLGLRMALCRRLVEAQGGALELNANKPGLELLIRLPRHAAAAHRA